jgi:hypothetical protein
VQKLYIKLPDLNEERLRPVFRMAALNKGDTPVVIFDARTKKYHALRNVSLSANERTISKLQGLFGEGNVVLK